MDDGVTLGSAEDQVKHAVSGVTAVEAHHHLTAPGHAISLPEPTPTRPCLFIQIVLMLITEMTKHDDKTNLKRILSCQAVLPNSA